MLRLLGFVCYHDGKTENDCHCTCLKYDEEKGLFILCNDEVINFMPANQVLGVMKELYFYEFRQQKHFCNAFCVISHACLAPDIGIAGMGIMMHHRGDSFS